MRSITILLVTSSLLGLLTNAYSQNDEKYYYKLGEKYMFTKDYVNVSKYCSDDAKKIVVANCD